MARQSCHEVAAIVQATVPGTCPKIDLAYSQPTLQLSWDACPAEFKQWWLETFISDPEELGRYKRMLFEVDRFFADLERLTGSPTRHRIPETLKRRMIGAAFKSLDAVVRHATKTPGRVAAYHLTKRIERDEWLTRS